MLLSHFTVKPSLRRALLFFFFFNDTATTEIYTLSLHDALPIFGQGLDLRLGVQAVEIDRAGHTVALRSEEHTSELQSRPHLVCRLLLEKKKCHKCCCGTRSRN